MVSKKVQSLEFLLLFAILAVIRVNMATEAYINHPNHILSFLFVLVWCNEVLIGH